MEEQRLYEELLRLKQDGRGGVLVTVVASSGSTPRKAGAKMLIRDDGSTLGTVGGGAVEQTALQEAGAVAESGLPRLVPLELTEEHGLTCGGSLRLYLEPLARIPRLLVVGKGHIARALQELGPRVGFAVTLLDGPEGDDAVAALRAELSAAASGREAAVVVACPTHHQDFAAALAALEAGSDFVGVVGSRRKRKALEAYLVEQGCERTKIDSLASPVGLDIGAETPAEIALSIIAQLIERRRHA